MTWNFAEELTKYGPGRTGGIITLGQARAYCARVTAVHYENFSVATLLLPRRLKRHVEAIYAYCRWSDDLADETAKDQATALLQWWRGEVHALYAGQVRHPVMIALQETIARFRIPSSPFLRLLDAFDQDQRITRYPDYPSLLGYCRNSADPVGEFVLALFECHTPDRVALSDRICTALQLANFWQDVARDYAIGRIYLPQDDCAQYGVTEADFARGVVTPGFRDLLRFEVTRTRELFREGEPLLDRLPGTARQTVELFWRGGMAILAEIEKAQFDVWTRRPVVSKWRKLGIMSRAAAGALLR